MTWIIISSLKWLMPLHPIWEMILVNMKLPSASLKKRIYHKVVFLLKTSLPLTLASFLIEPLQLWHLSKIWAEKRANATYKIFKTKVLTTKMKKNLMMMTKMAKVISMVALVQLQTSKWEQRPSQILMELLLLSKFQRRKEEEEEKERIKLPLMLQKLNRQQSAQIMKRHWTRQKILKMKIQRRRRKLHPNLSLKKMANKAKRMDITIKMVLIRIHLERKREEEEEEKTKIKMVRMKVVTRTVMMIPKWRLKFWEIKFPRAKIACWCLRDRLLASHNHHPATHSKTLRRITKKISSTTTTKSHPEKTHSLKAHSWKMNLKKNPEWRRFTSPKLLLPLTNLAIIFKLMEKKPKSLSLSREWLRRKREEKWSNKESKHGKISSMKSTNQPAQRVRKIHRLYPT